MIVLLVAIGAAIGAPLRYLTDRAVQARHLTRFPFGTLTVNVAASFVFGVLTGASAHVSASVQALVTTGFCGALSTFSTFGWETVALTRDGFRAHAVANVVGSVLACCAAAGLGWALGAA